MKTAYNFTKTIVMCFLRNIFGFERHHVFLLAYFMQNCEDGFQDDLSGVLNSERTLYSGNSTCTSRP